MPDLQERLQRHPELFLEINAGEKTQNGFNWKEIP
jgi:hypothetical protein